MLTTTFALGNALPQLAFVLAGLQVAERVAAFRRRQRVIQIAGGITMIVLAVALVLNLPAMLQRAVPDYTTAMQNRIGVDEIQHSLKPSSTPRSTAGNTLQLDQGITSSGLISNCSNGSAQLEQCANVDHQIPHPRRAAWTTQLLGRGMTSPNDFELLELAAPYALHAVSDAERADIERQVAAAPAPVAAAFTDEVRAVRETMAVVSAVTSVEPPAHLRAAVLASASKRCCAPSHHRRSPSR